jgi:hypothetical protein
MPGIKARHAIERPGACVALWPDSGVKRNANEPFRG